MSVDPRYFGVTGFAFPVIEEGAPTPSPPPPPIYDDTSPNVATHPPARIILQLINDLGFVTGVWRGFSPSEPDTPDYVIVTQDTEGLDQGRVQVGPRSELYGVQLRVRARRSDEAFAKAGEIARAFDEQVFNVDVVISGTTYLVIAIVRRGKVMVLGQDSTSNRYIVTFNLLANIVQRREEE